MEGVKSIVKFTHVSITESKGFQVRLFEEFVAESEWTRLRLSWLILTASLEAGQREVGA